MEASPDRLTSLKAHDSRYDSVGPGVAEQLRRYDSILDKTPTLLAYVDRDLRFRFASKAYCLRHQTRPEELVGKAVISVVGKELFGSIKDRVHAALAGDRQQFDVLMGHRDNGNRRWMNASYVPDRAQDGTVHGFFAFLQDVHEHKAVEASRARLQVAVDQGMEGFSLHDRDGLFTYVNRAEAAMYGYSTEEILGKNWRIFYSEHQTLEIEESIFPVLLREGKWRGELIGRKKDGETFDVDVSLTLLKDDQGEPNGLICNCRDITERKLAEESLRQLQKMEALGQLTGGIAHDFNNLLAVILGNLDLIRHQTPGDPRSSEFLEHALEAVERGAMLTRRLLLFSRKQPLEPRALDLNVLLRGMDDLMRRSLGERITIRIVEGEALDLCESDPSLLENVILNLALNARDAMPSGGTLTIETGNATAAEITEATSEGALGGNFVRLTVSDSGIGMPTEIQQQVFDPFFTTKSSGRGSGLGLSMVHGFVQQSDGHITLDSQEGRGTTFRLYLPQSTATQSWPEVKRATTTPSGQQEAILVVEDDPHVRRLVVLLLDDLGYRVFEADESEGALRILSETGIDLILTDVVLPGRLGGPELANQVWERDPQAKIVFMSGYNETTDFGDAEGEKTIHKIRKPFTRQELARIMRRVLEAPS